MAKGCGDQLGQGLPGGLCVSDDARSLHSHCWDLDKIM